MNGKETQFKKGHKPIWSEISREKVSNSLKGHFTSEETRKKIGMAKKGKKFTEEQRKNMAKSRIGLKQSAELIAKRVAKNTGQKRTLEMRKRFSESHKGEKSNLWKGGISPINKAIRMSIEFRLWREAVFARDGWICQECKIKGGILHPHHIKSFSKFPELRFAIDNGITLCKNCHKKTDNYANKKYESPVVPVGGQVGTGIPNLPVKTPVMK